MGRSVMHSTVREIIAQQKAAGEAHVADVDVAPAAAVEVKPKKKSGGKKKRA